MSSTMVMELIEMCTNTSSWGNQKELVFILKHTL
jgi:hypothetical protein